MAETKTQMTDEELKQELEKQVAPPAPEPIEFRTETGQVYKGKDWEEVAQELAKAQENATRTIREQKEQQEELVRQFRERQEQRIQEQPKKPSQFDKLKYFNTWQEDPYAAEREVIKQVLTEEFGVESFDQLKQGYEFSYQKSLGLHQNEEIFKFHAAHPEFSGSEEDSGNLTKWLEDNGYSMDPSRHQFITARDLEYAYFKLIEDGKIKPPEAEPEPPPARQGAPTLEGSGATSLPDPMSKVNSMSDKELESFLRTAGVLKY